MRTLVLRKGVGPLSSGTVIKKSEHPDELITELRSRTDFIPVNNRAKRRLLKRAEYTIMKELGF
jgi:hypothetical protein